ncbi:hypothetical protein [Candidatus Uabimicrobium sp. HlEnr_7]|uniref:hypothetical protein n=1 Tax=Candidatus Uabimicrobium helgolandensis TaxID=3095367 RepID=UPI0035572EA7
MKNKFVFLLVFVISALYAEDLSSMQKRNLKNAIYYLEKAEQGPSMQNTKMYLSYAERYANKLFAEVPEHEDVKKLQARVNKVKNLIQAEDINYKLKRQTSFAEHEVTNAEKGQYYSKERLLQRLKDMQKQVAILKSVDKNKYQKQIAKSEEMIQRASVVLGLDKVSQEEKLVAEAKAKLELQAAAKAKLELEAKLATEAKQKLEREAKLAAQAKEKLKLEAKLAAEAKQKLEQQAKAKLELEAKQKREQQAKLVKEAKQKNEQLSYRDKMSLKSVQSFLTQASRVTYPDVIAKKIKYAEEYLLPLQKKYSQHSEIKSAAELLQKQKARLSQITTKEPTATNPPKENNVESKKLSYQQRSSLKYASSRLTTVEKNIETLETNSKNPRMTKQYLEDYAAVARKNIRYANEELQTLEKTHPTHSQVVELRQKIKNFESQIDAILAVKNAEESAHMQQEITEGMKAINLLKQACQAKFDDKKMAELAAEKSTLANNRRNIRRNRYGSSGGGDFVRTKAKEIQKVMSSASIKKGFIELCNNVNNFSKEQFELAQAELANEAKRNQGPLVFMPPFKKFLELHKKPKFILFTFVGRVRDPSIQSHSDVYKAFTERAERYVQFLYKCDGIRNAREKELSAFRKESIAEAQKMVQGDEILQSFLDYYAVFGDKFNAVKSSLQKLKQELLVRVEVASKKAADQGFAKFKSQYQQVKADRQAMLKSPEEYQGKIIANAKFPVASWTKKGWFLPHGNEMFSYVWDPMMWKKFREVELGQFKIFRDFRQQIVDKHGLTLKNQMDWRYPGLLDLEFVAIIDGTTSFTPVKEVKDRYGKVLYTVKLPAIQVVNARVVGLKSRYFTLWLGGTDTNKHIDTSGLPK